MQGNKWDFYFEDCSVQFDIVIKLRLNAVAELLVDIERKVNKEARLCVDKTIHKQVKKVVKLQFDKAKKDK